MDTNRTTNASSYSSYQLIDNTGCVVCSVFIYSLLHCPPVVKKHLLQVKRIFGFLVISLENKDHEATDRSDQLLNNALFLSDCGCKKRAEL